MPLHLFPFLFYFLFFLGNACIKVTHTYRIFAVVIAVSFSALLGDVLLSINKRISYLLTYLLFY